MSRSHSTAGGCSRSHGSAAVARAIHGSDLGLDVAAPAVGVRPAGQIGDLTGHPARGRVGDRPFPATDLDRDDVARRQICVALLGAAAPLLAQAGDRVHHEAHLLDRVHRTPVAPVRLGHLGMARAAGDRERRCQRAAAGHPHLERGRLGHDARVCAHAVADGGQAAGARRLLVGDRVHDQVALQAHPEPGEHLGRVDHAGDAALHVTRPAAVEIAVAHLRPVGIARPAVARLRRNDVDMAVQEQAVPAAGAREPRRQLRAPVEPQARRHLPRPGDVGRVGLPDVHGGAGGAQALAEVGLQVGLLAGRVVRRASGRVEPDQPRRQLDQLIPAGGDRIQDACLQCHEDR